MLKKLSFLLVFVTICMSAIGALGLYVLVVDEPGSEIEMSNIQAILGQESPVFYNDGVTKLGAFFDDAHRQYVKYEEIPSDFINALVAAEDNLFFSHFGFDPIGIARATIKNLEAGRIVQGGSTLTQQTAKNLFKRQDRSLGAKLKELLYALRLEYHYSKEQIFEFYANQFYVSGNGHGLEVAARYYFDKKASELTLIECAFIAGSVKRPNYYNPFIQKDEEATTLALARGRERMGYVLEKMLELGMITKDVHDQSLAAEIPFKQGQVGFQLDYTMEIIKEAVSSDEVLEELAKHGIENISTSGIRIVTTVDKPLQDRAAHALRHDLSRLDTLLRGYEREEVQQEYGEIVFPGDEKLEVGAFLFGTVQEVAGKGKDLKMTVDFGSKLGQGYLVTKSFERLADARTKHKKNIYAKAGAKDVQGLAGQIAVGDRVWVSVEEIGEDGLARLDLEKYPRIQGGAIVVKNGVVLAMAGGVENRHFNRAIQARRTMGSSFKPFVYAAALQLGWNSADLLKNNRELFVYHNQPYFPRPDHHSPFDQVSMSWAGTKSENLASVWLVAHLCDQLNPVQLRDVAEHLDLTPRVIDGETESYRAYRTRIRDEMGILVNTETLRESAFKAAVRNSEADFMFENRVADHTFFKSINYGLNYDRIRRVIDREYSSQKDAGDRKELGLRRSMLSMNFQALSAMRQRLRDYAEQVEAFGAFGTGSASDSGDVALFYDLQTGDYVFQQARLDNANLEPVYRYELESRLFDMTIAEKIEFWDEVKLLGGVSAGGFDLLNRQMQLEYQRLERELPYSFEVLSDVNDFRIMVGLKYLIALAREMGIASGMEPVLSFPLGSNVVSLLETTRMYEGLVTGVVSTYGSDPEGKNRDSLLFIDRIESVDGELLYRPEQQARRVLGDKARYAVGHILENVVKYGTGHAAAREVKLMPAAEEAKGKKEGIRVPVLGKTGTANDYTNASFFGYLPGVAEDGSGLELQNGYAVGVYVGYDDNDAMRKSSIRIAGAAGALPSWIEIVNGLLEEEKYNEQLDPVELSFSGLQLNRKADGLLNLAADPEQGGIVASPARSAGSGGQTGMTIMTYGSLSPEGRFVADRTYQPFWRADDGSLAPASR